MSEKTNKKRKSPREKVLEYKKKLEAVNKREQNLASLPSTTLKEVLAEVDVTHYVAVPGMDKKLPFKRIGLSDFIEIQATEDRMKLVYAMLFKMLHAADSNVTKEMVGQIPFDDASQMMAYMTERNPFLKRQKSAG